MITFKRGRVHGPLAPYAVAFGEALARRGYTARSSEAHLVLMARLSRWLGQRQLASAQLGTAQVEEFLRWSHASGYRFPKSSAGAVPLLVFLRDLGVAPEPSAPVLRPPRAAVGTVLVAPDQRAGPHGGHHLELRSRCEAVVPSARAFRWFRRRHTQRPRSRRFCRHRVPGPQHPGGQEPGQRNPSPTALPLPRGDHACPSGRGRADGLGWSGGGLPRGVDVATVSQLLASCDRRAVKGSRDFAIMMLLARLALRAGEVAALDLDDIDWPGGQVLIRGKASRLERLPVPADVGEALAGYFTAGRPRCEERAVFLRVLAPHRRIGVGAISVIVHDACKRAGLRPIATHRLRHSVATELQVSGVASAASFGRLCDCRLPGIRGHGPSGERDVEVVRHAV